MICIFAVGILSVYLLAGTDDISVCEGVVQKTREQIAASLISDCEAGSSNEELVPVTPGTVRKVLGQIE